MYIKVINNQSTELGKQTFITVLLDLTVTVFCAIIQISRFVLLYMPDYVNMDVCV